MEPHYFDENVMVPFKNSLRGEFRRNENSLNSGFTVSI